MSDAAHDDPRLALLRARVRDIPDFPKPGILFRDLTPLMGDGAALRDGGRRCWPSGSRPTGPSVIVAIESRGFIFGAPVAAALGDRVRARAQAGQAAVARRRAGPTTLEYGTDALEMHADAVVRGRARGDRRRSAGDRRHRAARRSSWCASWAAEVVGRGVRRRAGAAARARAPGRRAGRRR